MILNAFLKALTQSGDRRFRGVLLKGFGLALALLFSFSALFVWGVGWFVGDAVTLPFLGTVGWVDSVLRLTAIPLVLALSVVLMVPVASAITSLFLDEVAQAVEDKHYPALPAVAKVPFSDAMRDTFGFLFLMAGANLLALILYLVFAPLAPLIFWGLNGFLLGREYFTLAAMRRVGRSEAKRLRRRHVLLIWAAGILMAVPLSVPIVNLLIPVLGAATFTHLFHMLATRRG